MTAEAVSQEDGDRHKGVHEERQIEATGRKCRKEQVHESERKAAGKTGTFF